MDIGKDIYHQSVLLHEVVEFLSPQRGEIILDATVGGGGHSLALSQWADQLVLIGLDLDSRALKQAETKLGGQKGLDLKLLQESFRNLSKFLDDLKIDRIDKAVFDLGFNSDQLTGSGRGFSFQQTEPLVMTLSDKLNSDSLTAEEVVNHWSVQSLVDIIQGYGEERYAEKIALAIDQAREIRPIKTTEQLAEVIEQAVPRIYRRQKIHPATRTFQALRITVNDEIRALEDALPQVLRFLSDGGRVAIISFHSLEDRVVKRQFRTWEDQGLGVRLTKKPVRATTEEVKANPRARSAKLRVFEKKEL